MKLKDACPNATNELLAERLRDAPYHWVEKILKSLTEAASDGRYSTQMDIPGEVADRVCKEIESRGFVVSREDSVLYRNVVIVTVEVKT